MLARQFGDMDAITSATVDELAAVPGIGPVLAESVHGYFHRNESRDLVRRLRSAGVRMEADVVAPAEGPLRGQTFVISGTLAAYSRENAEARIVSLGGTTTSSVTKATDFLVTGERPGSKLAKAQRYGTALLSDEEFMALLREHGAG